MKLLLALASLIISIFAWSQNTTGVLLYKNNPSTGMAKIFTPGIHGLPQMECPVSYQT